MGCPRDDLVKLQNLIDGGEQSDRFGALEYANFRRPLTRGVDRVATNRENIFNMLNKEQRNYVQEGLDELDLSKDRLLLNAKYGSTHAAQQKLGDVSEIKDVFVGFQRRLYADAV